MYPFWQANVSLGVHVPQFGNPCFRALTLVLVRSVASSNVLMGERRFRTFSSAVEFPRSFFCTFLKKRKFRARRIFVVIEQGFPTFLLPCTPSSFWQVNMFPYNLLWRNILSWLFADIFNNEHIMILENNIRWYMHKYLEINNCKYIFLLYCQP